VLITITNSCKPILPSDQECTFERFHRSELALGSTPSGQIAFTLSEVVSLNDRRERFLSKVSELEEIFLAA